MAERFGLIAEPDKVREIGAFYRSQSKAIMDLLLKVDADGFNELEAQSTLRKINVIINKMNTYVNGWSKRSVPSTYKDGQATAGVSLRIFGAKKDPSFNDEVHKNTIQKDYEETVLPYIKANNSIRINVETYFYLLRQAQKALLQVQAFDLRDEEVISALLDSTIKEGGSRGDLQSLIRQHFRRELFERKFININGRNYDMIKYAKTVARTRLRAIQSDAVQNSMEQYEYDLVKISSHLTKGRHMDDLCKSFDGKIFSISGDTPGYPQMPPNGWPPYHPSCEHNAAPTSVEAIESRGRTND